MTTQGLTYWQDGNLWLRFLDAYPDNITQGETLDALKENLAYLYNVMTSGDVPYIRRHAELEIV